MSCTPWPCPLLFYTELSTSYVLYDLLNGSVYSLSLSNRCKLCTDRDLCLFCSLIYLQFPEQRAWHIEYAQNLLVE